MVKAARINVEGDYEWVTPTHMRAARKTDDFLISNPLFGDVSLTVMTCLLTRIQYDLLKLP
jgi:hypothetical protein